MLVPGLTLVEFLYRTDELAAFVVYLTGVVSDLHDRVQHKLSPVLIKLQWQRHVLVAVGDLLNRGQQVNERDTEDAANE